MKIIKAKQFDAEKIAYINANRIDSFNAVIGETNSFTKIYFGDHKCEIDGDRTIEIANFMCSEDDCGFLDLTVEKKESAIERVKRHEAE